MSGATRPSLRHAPARVLIVLSTAALLAGCGDGIRRELGLVGQGPDEFAVIKRKPLSMPDDFSQLPEPDPDARNRVDPQPIEDAQRALMGQRLEGGAGGEGETALLAAAGAGGASDDIRDRLSEDAPKQEPYLLDRWLGRTTSAQQEPLDAQAEADRLIAERAAERGAEALSTSDTSTQE